MGSNDELGYSVAFCFPLLGPFWIESFLVGDVADGQNRTRSGKMLERTTRRLKVKADGVLLRIFRAWGAGEDEPATARH